MTALKYFRPDEFDCLCGRPECDAAPMDMETCLKLDGLRREFNQPVKITSARRCAVHNKKVKGKPTSWHLFGRAVDIHCPDGEYMYRLIVLAIKHGFSFGVKAGMVHLDTRNTPKPRAFGY